MPDLDAVLVPIGGGGLISGLAFALKSLKPSCKVYGVQVAGAPCMANSLCCGHIEELPSVATFADGIAVKRPGEHTFELTNKYVDEVVTVTDDEVASAVLALIEQQKLIAEGAGAGAVGAYIGGPIADFVTAQLPGVPGAGYVLLFGIYGVMFLVSVVALRGVRGVR